MKAALLLLAILLVVALRHREPDRAVMRRGGWTQGPMTGKPDVLITELHAWIEPADDGIQPSDPYPASFLP